jgi:energy-coupling factor transporter ATP-binding protein EcfA2
LSSTPALAVKDLAFRYKSREEWAVRNVSFELAPGEFMLVAGSSGCGKTTVARCLNGLIPRSYKGEYSGSVQLNGRDVPKMSLVEIAQVIGTLLQDPERQIVASSVYSEIAFGPENLGLPAGEIKERIAEVAKRLKIENLIQRDTFALSGGEKQKIALAGVLAMRPSILLLDEPLASLDSASSFEAVQLFRRLADEGTTILMIEHRVEDALLARPDRLLYMSGGEVGYLGPVNRIPTEISHHEVKLPAEWVIERIRQTNEPADAPTLPPKASRERPALIEFNQVSFAYGDGPLVLDGIDLKVYPGDQIAILGPNGAGKSTLVKHAIGLLKPTHGQVLIDGIDSRKITVAQNARSVGYVFQSPTHMLFAPTVREELGFGPNNLNFSPAEIKLNTDESVAALNLTGLEEFSPLGLSFGQQKRTTIAAVLAMRSKILILDEPTAGQDYANYTRFMKTLCDVGTQGGQSVLTANFAATVFITHDLDLAITYANRVVLLGGKKILADGTPEEVLQNYDLLAQGRIRPTSLLDLNRRYLPQTGHFLPAEALARL